MMLDKAVDRKTPRSKVRAYIGVSGLEQLGTDSDFLSSWHELLAQDVHSNFFQTPLWCLTWYRCYHDEYEPFVLTAQNEGRLIGLALLAIQHRTSRIVFAGDNMADYRDFLSANHDRKRVVELFLAEIMARAPGALFVLGQTQPESETITLVRQWAAASKRFRTITRSHECWRVLLDSGIDEVKRLLKKESVRRHWNFYQRRGELIWKRIQTYREWNEVKQEFFNQHSLRQVYTQREVTFQDQRKRQFFSALFETSAAGIHFSVLRSREKNVAFHFGYSHRGSLYFGSAAYDLLEGRHAPGIVHLVKCIEACQSDGYREVDLTIGDSNFKARLGNTCVQLPTVYIYGRRWQFWLAWMRKALVDLAKAGTAKITKSDSTWQTLKAYLFTAPVPQKLGGCPLFYRKEAIISMLSRMIGFKPRERVLKVTMEAFHPVNHPTREILYEVRKNRLEDFLLLKEVRPNELGLLMQQSVERIGQNHILHTAVINGVLAHYGWSSDSRPVFGGDGFRLPRDGVFLYDIYAANEHQAEQKLFLSLLLKESFASDTHAAYIMSPRSRALLRCLKELGFTPSDSQESDDASKEIPQQNLQKPGNGR